MGFRVFIIGAVVLIVFAVIATGQAATALFGVTWTSWLCASLLSFLVDILLNGWTVGVGPKQPPPQ